SEVYRGRDSLRLWKRDQNPFHQADDPGGYLQRLPPVLYGHAKVCGYSRARRQIPAAYGQDPGRPSRTRGWQKEEEVALSGPSARSVSHSGRSLFPGVWIYNLMSRDLPSALPSWKRR